MSDSDKPVAHDACCHDSGCSNKSASPLIGFPAEQLKAVEVAIPVANGTATAFLIEQMY